MKQLWKRLFPIGLATLSLCMIPSCGNQSTPTNERDNTFESPILSGESDTSDIVSDVDAPSLEESTSASGNLPAPEPPVESNEASAPVEQDEDRPDGRNWSSVFAMPTADEINAYQNQSTHRAPYIAGWLSIPGDTRYTEYVVDFKADLLPDGTYCCLGNWQMDYSYLERQYTSVRTEYSGVSGYAGFQSLGDGTRVSIMSFWDVYCTDADGSVTTIRAQRVYPEATDRTEDFSGEGTGAHCIVPYNWKAGYWYQMHLKCGVSQSTGNTIVEQWVYDYATGESTLLCAYDLGVPNVCFKGASAFFLENFLEPLSGEVRTMEVRTPAYLDADTQEWYAITSAEMHSEGGLPQYEGSYNFDADSECFWMITSGVGGDWYGNGTGQQGGTFSIG